jgi:tetratricopeptide (TPR) repeat protein
MTSAPCPNCGAAIRQNRADGRCVACGKLLPDELRAPADAASQAKTLRLPIPAFASHYDRALAHLKKGEYEPAIAAYTEAIQLDPQAPNAYLGRALAYRSVGDEANAVRDERTAKELGGAEGSMWARLVNRAYQLWKGDRQATKTEFYQGLHPLQRKAVLLWDLNRQVFNGGFPQWLQNGYGAWIEEIIDTLKGIGTDAARQVQEIVEGVSRQANEDLKSEAESDANLGVLLDYTDRYYAVAPAFGDDVEAWVEEQSRKLA